MNVQERKKNLALAQEHADKGDTLIRQHINENQLHIQLLRQQGLNRETIPEIKALYRESVELAKRHKVSLYVLYDFAAFLWYLHGYDEAIDLCLWLRKWYELEQASDDELARLSNLLGILCAESNRMEEAEKWMEEAEKSIIPNCKQVQFRDFELCEVHYGILLPDGDVICGCCGGKFTADERGKEWEIVSPLMYAGAEVWIDLEAKLKERSIEPAFVEYGNISQLYYRTKADDASSRHFGIQLEDGTIIAAANGAVVENEDVVVIEKCHAWLNLEKLIAHEIETI